MSQQQAQRFIEQAMYALQQGEAQQALAFADQACALAPHSSEAQLLRGIALSQVGHASAATEALNRAIQLSPHDSAGYYNLALHYYNLGYRTEAAHMATEALRIERAHQGALQLLELLRQSIVPPAPVVTPPETPEEPVEPSTEQEPTSPEPAPPSAERPGPEVPYGTGPVPPGAQVGPGGPYHQPPETGYYPPPPPRGLPLVRSLGSAWDAAAYLLIITGLVVFFMIATEYWVFIRQTMESAPGTKLDPTTRPISLLFFGVSSLSCLWMLLDVVDKQSSPLWLIPVILCCCCPGDWFFLALYLAVGRKP